MPHFTASSTQSAVVEGDHAFVRCLVLRRALASTGGDGRPRPGSLLTENPVSSRGGWSNFIIDSVGARI